MSSVGGWRAGMIGLLATAAIAAVTLAPIAAPTTASSPRAAAGENEAAAFGANQAVASSGIAAALPDAAQRAQTAAEGTANAARPVHAAPSARITAQAPVLDAAPSPSGVAPGASLAAADGLDVATDTTYLVDPAAHLVRVVVDLTAVNRLPVTPGARYYFPGVNLAVQLEAHQFTADEGSTHDRTTTQARKGYRLLAVQFAGRLYIGQTAHVRVGYSLPAGAPRSTSQVRVGAAYTTFVAWAFGDRGTVEVDVPSPFNVDVSGGTMRQGTGAGGQHVLTATATDAGNWYAWIDARNDSALTSRSLKLPDGEQVVVHAWPEDPTWEKAVSKTLATAIPALVQRIGLPWPVQGELSVLEVSGAVLEGYAGFYSPGNQQITISEAVDPLTVVHEASHAWFNASLFTDRWITEGLANEYAYRTLSGLGVAVDGPGKVRATASVAFPLDTWGTPAPIKTRTQDAREQWGYEASWTIIRQVVAKLGETKMATVFASANAGTTAYSAGGTPEKSTRAADWRRFVDLAEEVGGGRGIAEMIAPWVLTPAERALLAPRAAARAAYHDLLAKQGDWATPGVVRMDLDAWDFSGATSAIADAAAVLAIRDAIRVEAATEHVAIPVALETAYQAASSTAALVKTADDEQELRRSLDAVVAADAAFQAPRDWLVALGLVGQDPSGTLAAARVAWTSGDAATAGEEAASARAALALAADAGRLRLVAIGAGIVALALLAIFAITFLRRRSGAGRRASAAGVSGLASSPLPPDQVPASTEGWIDPRLAPPLPPPWWPPPVPSAPPAEPGPYPILPANAAAGPTPQSSADRQDEGAQ